MRGITGRSQSMGSHSIQPAGGAFNPSGAEATATTPIMHGGGGKQTICGKCLKPLPRCAICLMHMGSEMSVDEEVDGGEEEAEGKAETGDLMLMMESPSCESKETAVAPADEKNTKVKTSERVDTCKSTLSGKLTQKPPQEYVSKNIATVSFLWCIRLPIESAFTMYRCSRFLYINRLAQSKSFIITA